MLTGNSKSLFKHFGEPVTAERAGKTLCEFTGIYDCPDMAAQFGNANDVEARTRTIFATESDTEMLKRDDILVVRGERCRLARKRPDGTGTTLLILTVAHKNDEDDAENDE